MVLLEKQRKFVSLILIVRQNIGTWFYEIGNHDWPSRLDPFGANLFCWYSKNLDATIQR